MRKPFITACLLSAVFMSCKKEKPFSYEYIVSNTCDTAITVQVRHKTDTIIVIPKGTSKRIHFTYLYQKQNSPTFRELNNDFDTIIIRKYHIPSQHDYMKKDHWVFSKYSDVLASYTATVADAEF